MNILLFSWRDPKHPHAGGAEQVVHEHCKGWLRAGHSVTLFASRTGNLPETETIDGVKIIRSGNQYLGVQLAGFFYYLKNGQNFDLVIDQFHGIPFFTPIYVSKPRLALIQEVAQKVWFLNPLPWPFNWIIGGIGYVTEPMIFSFYKTTSFMTGSESAKKDVRKMGIPVKNITVVPHGVVLEGGKWKIKGGSRKEKIKTMVFLGVLSKDKGIEDALKCFAILSKIGQYQFWVIGRQETEEYGKHLESLIKELGLKSKVKFWGFVSLRKKFELLSKAHLLVNPSVHEGWGLVNIEANAMGTPVVAYSNAGLVDSVKNGVSGILIKHNNPESLALAIRDLLQDNLEYEKLKKGSLNWSEKFSWNSSIKKSLELLKKVVNET